MYTKNKNEENIMAYAKIHCPYCDSDRVVLYGKSKSGVQRYCCQNPCCSHKTFQLKYEKNGCKPGMKETIVNMAMNGSGTRDTARVLHVSKDTVTKVLRNLKKYAKPVNEDYLKTLSENSQIDIVIRNPLAPDSEPIVIDDTNGSLKKTDV